MSLRPQPILSQTLDEVLSTLLPSTGSSNAALDGNCLPIWTTLPADILTPVVAYLRLTDGARGTESFLFESAVKGETAGRWSFVGASESARSVPAELAATSANARDRSGQTRRRFTGPDRMRREAPSTR